MDRPLKNALDITPRVTTKWCVLVQVVLRRSIRQNNGPRFRNYVVTDAEGTLVSIMMYDKHIDQFLDTLEPYKRYYVSNAHVKDTPTMFKCLEYPYTWTLYRTNLVEPYDEPIPPPLPCKFQFDKFTDFYQYADHDKPICIKALIVDTLPVQQSSKSSTYRDCVVINEEMIPMLVRVWDEVDLQTDVSVYAKYKCPTLIIAHGLNVSTRHGLSLRTKTLAYFMENPPLTEDKPLLEWYNAHSVQITRLIETGAYRDPARLFHPPPTSKILPLTSAIASIQNVKAVWTEGTITFIPGQQHIWLETCEKCLTQLNVDTTWRIFCSYCKQYRNAIPLYSFGVFLKHGKTLIEASVRSPEIDKLLPYTAKEVMLAAAENKPLTNEIEAALQQKHIICYLKYYDKESQGSMRRRYPVLKIYSEAEVHEYNAQEQANALRAITSAENSELEFIGTSSYTPKTPAKKDTFTPAIQTVVEHSSVKAAGDKETQPQQGGAKRKLAFEQPDVTQPTALPMDKIPAEISGAQAVEKGAEEQSSTTPNTESRKKAKAKDNES